jgi:hypothetical protein
MRFSKRGLSSPEDSSSSVFLFGIDLRGSCMLLRLSRTELHP